MAQDSLKLDTQEKLLSYSFGYQISNDFALKGIKLDYDTFSKGFKDALDRKEGAISEDEMMEIIMRFQQDLNNRIEAERAAAGGKNKKEADEFLAKNKLKAGVVTTSSGLQYIVLAEGSGGAPKASDKVKVHYRGTFLNGEEFDSSIRRGQPAVFGVNQVIKGWTEALQLMKPGSKFKLFIPSELGYGPIGNSAIGPNEMLIFEVELIEIVK